MVMLRPGYIENLIVRLRGHAAAMNTMGESAGDGPTIKSHIAWEASNALFELQEENTELRVAAAGKFSL